MNSALTMLLGMDDDGVTKLIIILFCVIISIIAMVGGGAHSQFKRKLRLAEKLRTRREQTYSEVAAYIAEGSITPEEGERLIRAMKDGDESVEEMLHRTEKA